MAQRIFISYRRQDSRGDAGRIYDRLRPEFGEAGLFMDVAHIPLGVNFVKVLRDEVARCQALLAVIGPNWVDAKDEDGHRRLDDPNDFVRVEIAAALARDIPVIPILLEGTRMPKASALPPDLHELAQRNALDVRHSSFHADMDKLIAALKPAPKAPAATANPPNAAGTIITETFTIPMPGLPPFKKEPVIMLPLMLPRAQGVLPKRPSWSTNGEWLTAIPTADEVIANAGKWVVDFAVEPSADQVPAQFAHLFICADKIYASRERMSGSILTGRKWDRSVSPLWTVVHGQTNDGRCTTYFANLAYLGPTWRPEYAKLSDDVFKALGGKPLARFVTHP